MFLSLSTIVTSLRCVFEPLIMGFLTRCSYEPLSCYMVIETAEKLNYFPAKGGCSNYFSPREILHRVKLDHMKHCSMPLLSYVLAHDEPTLTSTVCTHALDCPSYVPFKPSKVGMNVNIFPVGRSLHDLTSLSFS